MKMDNRISVIALAIAAGWALPAHAQSADSDAVRQELAAMRAQMSQMAQRIDSLEGQLADAQAKAEAAQTAAGQAVAKADTAAATVKAKPNTEIAWDGAPKFTGEGGWSFKPRGRLQIDTGGVNAPRGIVPRTSLGVATELRRAFIGFDGTMPGGFGYRAEIDVANSGVEITDLYLTYKASPEVTLTVGQHKPFWGMEELTSDLMTSFMERAAFNSAFGFERRVGASATYSGKTLLVQGGIFTDRAPDLIDSNNSFSVNGRVVFMPKLGDGQLHLGASAYYRKFNDLAHVGSYGARPFVHTTDVRLINTGNIVPVDGERGIGAELAYIHGRFHASAESHWLTAKRPGLADPTFNGGYGEVGFLLTDDTTAYKAGVYDRIRPKNPVGKGGIGAIQVNARYDWLDLSDAGVIGGRQQIAGLSMIWIPTDYVRFLLNYGHLWINDAALPANGDRDYSADVVGARAQFDF
jgi:phosphate-selective porin OprO/OprP